MIILFYIEKGGKRFVIPATNRDFFGWNGKSKINKWKWRLWF